ncbi:MAG: hypothetical protein F6K20_15135 [Moorea sp. SIO2C4]|nr:hypothetical protein [Moorena sp. SIO2C4]
MKGYITFDSSGQIQKPQLAVGYKPWHLRRVFGFCYYFVARSVIPLQVNKRKTYST